MNKEIKIRALMGILLMGPCPRAGATEPALQPGRWPEAPPQQLREEIFGIRLRYKLEFDGAAAARKFILTEMERNPQPHVKAYRAWYCLAANEWGAPDLGDVERGRQLALDAMKGGSLVARSVLGQAIVRGAGNMDDTAYGLQLLHEAETAGSAHAMMVLSILQIEGRVVPLNFGEAVQRARRAAELGETAGEVAVGVAFERGKIDGTPDFGLAEEHYLEAAQQGADLAWRLLLNLEKQGAPGAARYRRIGRLRDANDGARVVAESIIRQEAEELAAMAAGNNDATVELARAHIEGRYAKRDYVLARRQLAGAAAEFHREARFFLAQMRVRGQGGPKEPAALKEILDMADAGEPYAATYLGWLHYWGVAEVSGIKKDEKIAFERSRQAAERGFLTAQMNLGFCYENGIGTPVNYALAAKVFWQAHLRGSESAAEEVRRLLPFVKI